MLDYRTDPIGALIGSVLVSEFILQLKTHDRKLQTHLLGCGRNTTAWVNLFVANLRELILSATKNSEIDTFDIHWYRPTGRRHGSGARNV